MARDKNFDRTPVVPIKWYGDMSSLLLDDQKIVPQKLLELKHLFLYPNIHAALSNIIEDIEDL